jgi:putative ABC transport system permease protein
MQLQAGLSRRNTSPTAGIFLASSAHVMEHDLFLPFAPSARLLDPVAALPAITDAIHKFDADVVIAGPGTVEQSLRDDTYAGPRFALITFSAFATVGLLFVASGIFSVMACAMSQRTHEIGIRIAVGAQRSHVLRMVLQSGALLIGGGVFVSALVSVVLVRLLASQIWGVSATDPGTFISAVTLLIIVGLAACLVPAQRATLIDPLVALRYE